MAVSLRKAINAKCKDCIHDPKSGLGTWRHQVERCTAKTCPLWPVRPIRSGISGAERVRLRQGCGEI